MRRGASARHLPAGGGKWERFIATATIEDDGRDESGQERPQEATTEMWRAGNGVESADKPGSVVGCHSSGRNVTVALEQPTREQRGPRHCSPIWPCSRWGLPCHDVLPRVRCALTAPFHPYLCHIAAAIGGLLSAALSVDSRRPGVTWHRALWSPDFPRRPERRRDNLANSGGGV